ncbi:MAG TPA: intradiol ring-cleavage dioxygenase, partial [Gaiellaceae bacterium]|nr:intradiol ring-cleavage dioxygenase [Gaiellaceae bacterium]
AGLAAGAAAAAASWPTGRAAASGESAQPDCVLAPEQSEGPFWLDTDLVRRDLRDGKPGVPLELRLRVVDATTCRPLRGALVDVWHCDAAGVYSGVQGARGRFLRGIQRTDARGLVTFRTIYPGWYPGRTVHVHVKVALGGNVVHTGQLYFPDALTDAVFRRQPYARRPSRSPRNPGDALYRDGGRRSTLRLRSAGRGYVGTLTLGVRRG